MPRFAITFRAARVNRGLTVMEVASKLQKDAKTISRYERDSTDIPRDLSVKLCDLYQVPDELVFFGKESSFHGFVMRKRKQQKSS